MTLLARTLALATIILGVSTSHHAQAKRFSVGIGTGSSFVPSDSMDALTSKTSYAHFDLEAGMQVFDVPNLGIAEVALQWDVGTLRGTSFERIDSELFLHTLMLRGRIHRDLRTKLTAFAEVGMGIQWGRLSLEDVGSALARPLEDSDKALASTIGAGLEYQLGIVSDLVALGFQAKLSYRAVTSLEFRATPRSEGGDELLLGTSSADLGSVNTSGAAFGVGLVGRF